jgi:hypothetical protein
MNGTGTPAAGDSVPAGKKGAFFVLAWIGFTVVKASFNGVSFCGF